MSILILHWACRVFLGAIFIYAGYTKLAASPLQFAATIEAYQLLPAWGVIWAVKIIPWLEIVLGLVILSGIAIRWTAGFAAALLAAFIIAMAITYARGIEADCGCFGIGEKISLLTLLRDSLFLLPAFFLLFVRTRLRYSADRLTRAAHQ